MLQVQIILKQNQKQNKSKYSTLQTELARLQLQRHGNKQTKIIYVHGKYSNINFTKLSIKYIKGILGDRLASQHDLQPNDTTQPN